MLEKDEYRYHEVSAMVIDAILLNTQKHTDLLRPPRAAREAKHQALQRLSERFQLGGGRTSDYLLYGHLLFEVDEDRQGAADALSHAIAICEPGERFRVLVICAHRRVAMSDHAGALKDLSEADTLGQLDFLAVKQLAELHSAYGDAATAIAMFDRAAVMEPSNARIRQQLGGVKLFVVGDAAGAVADLDAAVLLGMRTSPTYRARGCANMKLGQLQAALADMDQAVRVAQQSKQAYLHVALTWRAVVRSEMGDFQGAVSDMDAANDISPLSESQQLWRQQCLKSWQKPTHA